MSEDYGVKIGTASLGDGGNNWKVQGKGVDNIYLVLPPLGELADEGKWECGHAGHWGYENTDKKLRMFKCIEVRDYETKKITTICPECSEHIYKIKAERDKKFADGVAYLQAKQGMGKEQAERTANERLKGYDEALRRYNRSYRIYMNAVNEKGEIGVLNMSYRHLKLLKKEMADFRKLGVDPLSIKQGVWFNFKYSGMDDQTVKAVYIGDAVNGQKLKPGGLTTEVLKRLKNEACLNLSNPWEAARLRELTADQIRMLVKSNGDPTVVDTLFSRGEARKVATVETVDVGGDFSGMDIPGMADLPSSPPASTPSTPNATTPDVLDPFTTKSEAPSSAPLSPPDVTATDPEFSKLFGDM